MTLNSVSMLRDVPDAIIVDIQYSPAQIEDVSMDKGKGHGVIITKRRFSGASVEVFYDLSIYSPEARQNAIMKVQAWAINGGILRTSDRKNQRLKVRCITPPTVGSALRWTELLSIKFQADELPFWEAETENVATITGGGTFSVGGIVDNAQVSASVTSPQTITTLAITCGDTTINLNGISVPAGTAVTIDYDDNGFLRIYAGGTNLMAKRTGSDELLAPCGKATNVRVLSNVSVSCVLRARGRWL